VHHQDLVAAQRFDPRARVEDVLVTESGGDFTSACWEPGQVSPLHCHPWATEAYLCLEGGGTMRTPTEEVTVVPGSFVVHPPGEWHEYENGAVRSVLYRVRYGADLAPRTAAWRGQPDWRPDGEDADYLRDHPLPGSGLTG
jgi:quercetin dioxygenase-like cupin family protein